MKQCNNTIFLELGDDYNGIGYNCLLSNGHNGRHRWIGTEKERDVEIIWEDKSERTDE